MYSDYIVKHRGMMWMSKIYFLTKLTIRLRHYARLLYEHLSGIEQLKESFDKISSVLEKWSPKEGLISYLISL